MGTWYPGGSPESEFKTNNRKMEKNNMSKSKITAKQIDTKVITNTVRLGYVQLLEPKAMEGQTEKKYSAQVMIDKEDTETLDCIYKAIDCAKENAKSRFKGNAAANLKTTLRDGDEEVNDEGEPKMPGFYFINVSSKNKPGVVDLNVQPLDDPDRVYSGVYARVAMNFYAYDANGNRGITAGLNNVQIVKDGPRLGGATAATDDFSDGFELDEEDDDLM